MDAGQMKYEFRLIYELDNLLAPGLNDRQISTFLTDAQLSFVKTRYTSFGNKYRKGFESIEKRRKDLSALVGNIVVNSPNFVSNAFNKPNGYTVSFDAQSRFLYSINEELITNIRISDCVRVDVSTINDNNIHLFKRISVIPKTHDEYNINIDNPFKSPDSDSAWRLDVGEDEHEIITDGSYLPVRYICRYIKYPMPIIVPSTRTFTIDGVNNPPAGLSCELDESVHREIVKSAVRIATAITNQQEYQIKANEEQVSE
jgi:hypothetical protein